MTAPGPGELWVQAGGGTPAYSRARYIELMTEAGYLRYTDQPTEEPQPLPCGWPGRALLNEAVDRRAD